MKKCLCCHREVNYIGHHVHSKGAAGKHIDEPWNLMPICHEHHTLRGDSVHRIGLKKFAENYIQVEKWLLDNGWEKIKDARLVDGELVEGYWWWNDLIRNC